MKFDILHFVKTEILGEHSDVELCADDDLLASEIVDSMGVMRLIGFIEDKFSVKVPPEDVTIENFFSVNAMCNYLSRRAAS